MEEVAELKEKLLKMMSWFHEFCKENDLKYYVLGGTMLGAVRHGGFIPWDDDIDVGMPRKDYERLSQIMGDRIHGKYLLETPDTQSMDYYYTFSKIYDTDTTLIENTRYKIRRGIYLDIFPLDGIGENYENAKYNFSKIKKLDNMLMLKTAGFRKGRKLYKNIGVALFRLIPISSKKLLKILCRECAKKDFDAYEFGGNLVGAWGIKEIFHRSVMGEPTLYKFESIMVYGAEKADEYLKGLYGDWKQLPPTEKRVSHHDYILRDLKTPYIKKG
ncbi:MAG: LicD family protein [Clostridia bacterium]|nr:LicD family protein [Clostridia bacterium]